jgi:TRAP-type uncharacterized transport system substrate-binding protein
MRSLLILEAVRELIKPAEFPFPDLRLELWPQGTKRGLTIFASTSVEVMQKVARREVDIAMVNPSGALTVAYRGKGSFTSSVPLRAITVMPSLDRIAFGIASRTGLQSLADIKTRHYPLKLSLRAWREHAVHLYVDEVLKAHGFSLADIIEWGGKVVYDPRLPFEPERLGPVRRGEIDAIFDEAVQHWINPAIELGMNFMPLEGPILHSLEDLGLRRSVLRRDEFPGLPGDVPTLDFSGWPVYTHAGVDEELIYRFCRALEARKSVIPWEGSGDLPLATMCRDTPAGPLGIPLHPGAERCWREVGYLG